ncbi:flagellar assembly peptidoglycan hydrolase FlgJ [Pantoea septica]|uniref:flagellar assembly peptidoglycan hydrolase FlgJ n=1 Tax=Pantoea septica TaxID=472695 RepID=UPI002898AACF|nr:flagellar assembly peptidoglycan hydrolase FlgJ [Pantoea septica]
MAESMNNIGAAFDSRSLDALKRVAKSDRQAGLKGAAKQMEAVFVQMMLKSMRDATPKEGLFSSQQSEMFTSMLDQQLAQNIASKGTLGFAGMMLKSLGAEEAKQEPAPQALVQTAVATGILLPAKRPQLTAPLYSLQASAPIKVAEAVRPTTSTGPVLNNANFIASLSGPAIAASKKSGVPHQLIIAQAALESGWGNREIPTQDGRRSHNLFGIKATPDWQGETTEVTTTEYINGVAKKVKAAFRVYQSYAEGLADYAALIARSPRYRKVSAAKTPESGAHALQAGGYATDPNYANKLINIIQQVKNRVDNAASAYKSDLSSLF